MEDHVGMGVDSEYLYHDRSNSVRRGTEREMASKLYSFLNPFVKVLLRSPLHGLLSQNTMLLEFTGRKSGRKYVTPVSYYEGGGRVHCFAARDSAWWRNLIEPAPVRTWRRRQWFQGTARAELEPSEMLPTMRAFLTAVPRDAPFAGVRLNAEGRPREDDLVAAIQRLALVTIEAD